MRDRISCRRRARRSFRVGAGRRRGRSCSGLAVGLVARIMRGVIAAIRVELPFFASDPGQHAAFDAREVGADQHVPGRRDDHASGRSRRPPTAAADTAGTRVHSRRWRPRRWRRRYLQPPAASNFAAGILHRPSGRWMRRGIERRRARGHRRRRAASSASIFLTAACAPPRRSSSTRRTAGGKSSVLKLPLDCFAVELCAVQPCCCSHCQQPRDLIDPGDGAAGDLGELGIDLRRRRLCDPPRRFGKLAINTEAALIDPAAQLPERLFGRRQRRQPLKQPRSTSTSCRQ